MWSKIENLPDIYKETKRMFVVIGIGIPRGTTNNYTTDPYCVWRNEDGTFERWPHDFQPTHFYELPLVDIFNSTVKIKESVSDNILVKMNLPPYIRNKTLSIIKVYEDVYCLHDNPKLTKYAQLKDHDGRYWSCPLHWLEVDK